MLNRRECYRHRMGADRRLAVQVTLPGEAARIGTIIDLSVGGIAVRLPRPKRPLPSDTWSVSFLLSSEHPALTLPAELVHLNDEASAVGRFRFLPLIDPRASEEAAKRIWVYLLNEQRRARQLRLTA